MALTILPADQVLQRLHEFDSIIDARSEDEYAHDHLPHAINWPTLHNAERKEIGTLYKQVSAFEAKKRGAAIAAHNIAQHIEREVLDKPREWKPLAYCWRGGKRSGALALILDQIGFRTTLVEGGYKAFRSAMLFDCSARIQALQFRVVCGTTGSGKTRLLHALAQLGAQVLDLEGLAQHRSSVLGAIPGVEQPSQKRFDTLVWDALRKFDPARPVFVESESKKVGNVALTQDLVDKMRASPCLRVALPLPARVDLLLEDYPHMVQEQNTFCAKLDMLIPFLGKATIMEWKDHVLRGELRPVVEQLLTEHYDPAYLRSINRNFSQYANCQAFTPSAHSMAAMLQLGQQILETVDSEARTV